jgi:hypothetical protein
MRPAPLLAAVLALPGCAAALTWVAASRPLAQAGSAAANSGPPPSKEEQHAADVEREAAFEDLMGLGRLMPPEYYKTKVTEGTGRPAPGRN